MNAAVSPHTATAMNPAVAAHETAADATRPPCASQRVLVLVVDDDAVVRMMVAATLEQQGFEVIEAADGGSGVSLFDSRRPDLVLCDVMMPGMDGFQVCDALRARPDTLNLPIVMLTGLDDTASIAEAFARGATDFIVKPITWPLLPHRLRYLARACDTLEALHRSEERYALAARGANDGLWDWDLVNDVIHYSPRWKQMLGYCDTMIGERPQEWFGRVHDEDIVRLRAELDAHLDGADEHFQSEHRMRAAGGDYRWVMVRGLAVRDATGRATRMAGSQTDTTGRKAAEAQLIHDALHDALTGLANRSLFLDRMLHCIELAERRADYRFAVLFLDLDRFKVVNDSLGHLRGDHLLVAIADRLRATLRAGDTLARLGGDEFTILLEDIEGEGVATHMAERIQQQIACPVTIGDQEVVMSASIGIALSSTGYSRAEDMLRDADAAMYRAKDAGRGRYELFDTAMHARAVHALQIESELRQALEQDQFKVWYQPITELDGGRVAGFEALVRWQHPQRGLLLPEEFLGVACETRLIVPMGRRVLDQSCAQLARWRATRTDAEQWYVSVNLSSQELAQQDLLGFVDATLERNGLEPAQLRLEVTEGSLIENTEHCLAVMRSLRERGVRLSIDDFGTGYSSLNYLHRYPFDTLKIDRSFVRALHENPQQRDIVRAVITLAHNLGLAVVAEGSEDLATMDVLEGMDCEFAQGWSIARPLPPEKLDEFLHGHADARKAIRVVS